MAENNGTLDKVRKLLAKAEAEGCTPEEAEALTAKAAELMAKYGIDRLLLAAEKPETDKPGDKVIQISDPWGRVQAHLLCGLAAALRCQPVIIASGRGTTKVHVFGYESDLERLDVLYTSVLLQMFGALRASRRPDYVRSVRAWNRSFLLGFCSTVIARVKQAENLAAGQAASSTAGRSTSVALAIVDRATVISHNLKQAYPETRTTRVTYSGSGYGQGSAAGQRADIGGSRLGRRTAGALR